MIERNSGHPFKPGRKRIVAADFQVEDVPDGLTVAYRDQVRRDRAAKPRKHAPDRIAQRELRAYARWRFENLADEMQSEGTA